MISIEVCISDRLVIVDIPHTYTTPVIIILCQQFR